MNLSLWIAILALATTVVTAWLYLRISESQIDDNIINATNSLLTLLEKAKKLEPHEQRLLADWLNDWEYFDPPRFIKKRRVSPKKETIENLKQYFNGLAAGNK
jgi:hypothetical protein